MDLCKRASRPDRRGMPVRMRINGSGKGENGAGFAV